MGHVALGKPRKPVLGSAGAAEKNDQKPRGKWIEGAGVPELCRPKLSRSPSGGLA